jgi:two-component system chemotaxis response regulator CheY
MQRTVMIVEDADTCASTLEIALSGVDQLNVVIVQSGEAAWDLLEHGERPLSAVVTDLEMRGMDGFELIERIRAHRVHGKIPIMVITGSSDPDAPDRAGRLGANAFFMKPYSPLQVREKLEQLLNQ